MSDSSLTARGSAYGTGAPAYADADRQRHAIQGRLNVALGIRDRYRASGDQPRAAKWGRITDELLDRLLEVRGK